MRHFFLIGISICLSFAVVDFAMAQGTGGGMSSEPIGSQRDSGSTYTGPGVPGLPGAPGNYGGTSAPSQPGSYGSAGSQMSAGVGSGIAGSAGSAPSPGTGSTGSSQVSVGGSTAQEELP